MERVSYPQAGPILEIGTGSGRVTKPLQSCGARLAGIDVSRSKLVRIPERQSLCLAQADAAYLPFPNDAFMSVVSVHVLHLVENPVRVIREIHRVLKPGCAYYQGVLLIDSDSVWGMVRRQWQTMLDEKGIDHYHTDTRPEKVDSLFFEVGASFQPILVEETTHETTPAKELQRIAGRLADGSWSVPETMLPELSSSLERWTRDEFGSLDRTISYQETWVLREWHFPETLEPL